MYVFWLTFASVFLDEKKNMLVLRNFVWIFDGTSQILFDAEKS